MSKTVREITDSFLVASAKNKHPTFTNIMDISRVDYLETATCVASLLAATDVETIREDLLRAMSNALVLYNQIEKELNAQSPIKAHFTALYLHFVAFKTVNKLVTEEVVREGVYSDPRYCNLAITALKCSPTPNICKWAHVCDKSKNHYVFFKAVSDLRRMGTRYCGAIEPSQDRFLEEFIMNCTF
jgi:hypothetical protein